ncbi:unnamed protein product [Ambrosiozyma monospora]|uniref:Unnamed protein product n=1 Tax=Ambrosiozyma monospora TaxID=43982 RepID=A0ACB5T4S8_AMBMO|nr:unnamed protein product [Ambrosiozyma monospora]
MDISKIAVKTKTKTQTTMTKIPSKKRNKLSFTCLNCRRKKIKCDRKLPCYNCVKANLTSSCEYTSHPLLQAVQLQQQSSFQGLDSNPPFPETENTDGTSSEQSKTPASPTTHNRLHQHENGISENDYDQLKREMLELKQKLSSLEEMAMSRNEVVHTVQPRTFLASKTETITPSSPNMNKKPGILDLKLPFNKPMLMMKPSRNSYQGPVSVYSVMSNNMSNYTQKVFRNFLGRERKAFKTRVGKSSTEIFSLLYSGINENKVVLTINNVISPHYRALYSLLIYFKDHLNDLRIARPSLLDLNITMLILKFPWCFQS